MGTGEVARFGKCLSLLDNRIEVINYMLGYGIRNSLDNPMIMSISRGDYLIRVGDCEMDRFRIYDSEAAQRALDRIDGLNDGIWYMLGKWIIPKNTT